MILGTIWIATNGTTRMVPKTTIRTAVLLSRVTAIGGTNMTSPGSGSTRWWEGLLEEVRCSRGSRCSHFLHLFPYLLCRRPNSRKTHLLCVTFRTYSSGPTSSFLLGKTAGSGSSFRLVLVFPFLFLPKDSRGDCPISLFFVPPYFVKYLYVFALNHSAYFGPPQCDRSIVTRGVEY
jgi:hypothetical protein